MKRMSLLLSALCLIAGPAIAQDKYPSKPVKIVVPYAPGGATDITSRLFGEQLKNILGQQFVVESKPGAFGVIALEEMARARPDGYTLFVGNVSTNAITPVLYKDKFKIDFDKEITSVSRLATYPSFLIVSSKGLENIKTTKDLIDYAKKNPGKVRYTSAGVGSFPHFDMEIFARRAGADMIHIPNKSGAAGMINDLVVGDVHTAFINAASTAAMIKAGSLRPLAVLAEKRWPITPTSRRLRKPATRTSARCTGRACWRPPPRRRTCLRPCTRRSSKPPRRRRCSMRSASSRPASIRMRRWPRRRPGSRTKSRSGRRSPAK